MEKERFSEFVVGLAYHFGQDKYVQPGDVTARRLRSWFAQVSHLPDEPLDWVESEIKKRWSSFPRNLSKAVLELWDEWLAQHPRKKAQQETCNYCFDGWILARQPEQAFEQAVRCGHCNKPGPQGVWAATQSQIRERGWEVNPGLCKG